MDATTLARAAEPFFSTKDVGSGTGLGLSMVHGLVLQQNGDLRITSSLGRGTTVDLWLPISSVPTETPGSERGDIGQATESCGTVLVVDDEELVRMSTAHMLSDLGYHVVEAGSGEEALRLVNAGLCPDILVTDYMMPGMNGAELARNLWRSEPDLPVLIVSGYVDGAELEPALPRLSKPFRSAELEASVLALRPQTTDRIITRATV
jgi:CheY-like chemotaxis protein